MKARCSERRKGSHGQGSGETANEWEWLWTGQRRLEGQRGGTDTGGAAHQGEGQRSTLHYQKVPRTATPNGAGESSLGNIADVYFVSLLVLTFLLHSLVGGVESFRVCAPRSGQESHQWAGVPSARVRQSKRVLYLYFPSLSFIHLLSLWTEHSAREDSLSVRLLQQSDACFGSHQLSSWRGSLSVAVTWEEFWVRRGQGSLRVQRAAGGQKTEVRGEGKEVGFVGITSSHAEAVAFTHQYVLLIIYGDGKYCCKLMLRSSNLGSGNSELGLTSDLKKQCFS